MAHARLHAVTTLGRLEQILAGREGRVRYTQTMRQTAEMAQPMRGLRERDTHVPTAALAQAP